MLDSMDETVRAIPVACVLAAGAYLIFFAAIIFPLLRQWLIARLVMPAPSNQAHLAALDGFRGLAALWVASFHSWQWWALSVDHTLYAPTLVATGNKAVPLFAGLSGFLIYRALQRVSTVDGLRRYVRNRVFRIFPLYFSSVLAVIAFNQLGSSLPKIGHAIAELFMLRTFSYPGFANPPAWSLYVEVLFYIVAPLVVLTFGGRARFVALIGFIVLAMTDGGGPRELQLWKYFLVGSLSSDAYDFLRGHISEMKSTSIFVAGLIILGADILWLGSDPPYTVTLAAAVALIIVGATLSPGVAKFFSTPPWRILGAVSYSLYIWHSFLIIADGPMKFDGAGGLIFLPFPNSLSAPNFLARIFIMLPAFLLVATASFLLIERPFLMLRFPDSATGDPSSRPEYSSDPQVGCG